MSQQNPNPKSGFVSGMVLTFVLHIVFLACWLMFFGVVYSPTLGPFRPSWMNYGYNQLAILVAPFLFLGIVQIIYLLPAYFYFARKGRSEVCKGLLVGGLVSFMLNGACSGSLTLGGGGIATAMIVLITSTIGVAGIWYVMRSDRSR
jgi:hypothetical protein